MSRDRIILYSTQEVAGIRRAARASAQVLEKLAEAVCPGMSTLDLDKLAREFIAETGGKSAFYNYHGYPGQVCISLNNEVVHGIGRADRIIAPGDIVSLDVGVAIGGYVGDNALSLCAGGIGSPEAMRLLEVTEKSLMAGIAQATEGNCVSDIGIAVETMARAAGFGVVRDMVGHGCGRTMHEPPEVPNYRMPGHSPMLKAGMVICIEPMINAGTWRIEIDREDKWTVRTLDGSLSAHFEHQILITKDEPEILSWRKSALKSKEQ